MDIYKLKRQFNPVIYKRGIAYFEEGRVRVIEQDSLHISAEVDGTETYECSLFYNAKGTMTRYYCSCPYGGLCKHLASLLPYVETYDENDELVKVNRHINQLSIDDYKSASLETPLLNDELSSLDDEDKVKALTSLFLSMYRAYHHGVISSNDFLTAVLKPLTPEAISLALIKGFRKSGFDINFLQGFINNSAFKEKMENNIAIIIEDLKSENSYIAEELVASLYKICLKEVDYIALINLTDNYYDFYDFKDDFINKLITLHYYDALYSFAYKFHIRLSFHNLGPIVKALIPYNKNYAANILLGQYQYQPTMKNFIEIYSLYSEEERRNNIDKLLALSDKHLNTIKVYIGKADYLTKSEMNKIPLEDFKYLKDVILDKPYYQAMLDSFLKRVQTYSEKKNLYSDVTLAIIEALFTLSKTDFHRFIFNKNIQEHLNSNVSIQNAYLELMMGLNAENLLGYYTYED